MKQGMHNILKQICGVEPPEYTWCILNCILERSKETSRHEKRDQKRHVDKKRDVYSVEPPEYT